MLNSTQRYSDIRRSRPSYSCMLCRERRVKCDQNRPQCGNCVRNNAECIYQSSPPPTKRPRISEIDEHSSVRRAGSGRTQSTRPTSSAQGTESGSSTPLFDQLKPGFLVLDGGGRARYTESIFWACVDAEGLELDHILPNLPLFQHDRPVNSTSSSVAYQGGSHGGFSSTHSPTLHSLFAILQQIPPKSMCDTLVAAFFEHIHPLIPLVHGLSFKRAYSEFWTWYQMPETLRTTQHGIVHQTPSFVCMLVSTLCAGAITIHNPHVRSTGELMRRLTPETLRCVGFPNNPSMYALMAYILVNSISIREEDAFSTCSFVAVSVRIAEAMGLHRDGTEFDLDPVSTEERRRVWWHLVHLDIMSSIAQGLPPVVSTQNCTTRVIVDMSDAVLDRLPSVSAAGAAVDYTGPIDKQYVLAGARYEASGQLRTIVETMQDSRGISLQTIEALETSTANLKTRIAARLERAGLGSLSNQATLNEALEKISVRVDEVGQTSARRSPRLQDSRAIDMWSQALIHLTMEKAYCIIYQPLMLDKTAWQMVRNKAIPHLQHFLALFLDMSTDPSYQPFHWLYPGSYRPLQPCAALLTDLSMYPQSPRRFITMQLIDRAFALIGHTDRNSNRHGTDTAGFSLGARQVWTVLDKMRTRVWNRLGYDSSVYWGGSHSFSSLRPSHPSTLNTWLSGNLDRQGDSPAIAPFPGESLPFSSNSRGPIVAPSSGDVSGFTGLGVSGHSTLPVPANFQQVTEDPPQPYSAPWPQFGNDLSWLHTLVASSDDLAPSSYVPPAIAASVPTTTADQSLPSEADFDFEQLMGVLDPSGGWPMRPLD